MRIKITLVLFLWYLVGGTIYAQNNTQDKFNISAFAAQIISNYAQSFADQFQYEIAITLMDYAIQLDDDNSVLLTARGQMIMLIYEWDRAIADYNYAIELTPEYADVYFHRGIAFYSIAERIDRHAALDDLQTYLILDPNGIYAVQATAYIQGLQFEIDELGE